MQADCDDDILLILTEETKSKRKIAAIYTQSSLEGNANEDFVGQLLRTYMPLLAFFLIVLDSCPTWIQFVVWHIKLYPKKADRSKFSC